LAGDYDQLLGRDPTSAELSAETSELANDATGVTSPTWQGLFAAIDNGFTKFLTEVNPIGSAIAASATTSPAQRAANLAAAKAALADPNVAAMIKTLQAAENGSFNGINGTQPPVSDLSHFPKSATASSAAGAIQILRDTYNEQSNKLGLFDFFL
jgi:hypothetical protein